MRRREILRRLHAEMDKQGIPRLHLYLGTDQPMLKDSRPMRVNTSREAFDVLQPFFMPFIHHVERIYLLLLDRGHRVIGAIEVASGGIVNCTCDPKVIFGAALTAQASTIIVAHNHPSGQLRPSIEDIDMTRKIVAGARSLDISMNDHLIITSEGYYSFADNGQLA